MDQQSYMAWDIKHTLLPMAKHALRSPDLLNPDGNPLSRANSYVSQLSSDLTGSDNDHDQKDDRQQHNPDREGRRQQRRTSATSENELKCRNCGNGTFRATMTDTGQRFRCKKCGTVI